MRANSLVNPSAGNPGALRKMGRPRHAGSAIFSTRLTSGRAAARPKLSLPIAAVPAESENGRMKRLFPLLLVLALAPLPFANPAWAAEMKGVTYSVTPIVGYQLERKDNPARAKQVLIYGARVIAGWKILSAEGEYTIGDSNEVFADTGTRIEEKTERIRAGLRSTYSLGTVLDWHLRGGAEAQRRDTTRTVGGVSTKSESPSKVYPYVGTGVEIHVASQLSLNAGVVATIKDLQDMKQNEYATTLGVRINFNAR